MVSKIRKRNGSIVPYDESKISSAIAKALLAIKMPDKGVSAKLARQVTDAIGSRFKKDVPSVEDVQDAVENILIQSGCGAAAKAYILYRKEREKLREAKKALGVSDDLKLGINAAAVLERRYLRKNEKKDVIETPGELFRRVAKAIAAVDLEYGRIRKEVDALETEFYEMMTRLEFLPNSPTLMNAGTDMGQLSACFVVPIEDSMESIFDAVKSMALIHQSGGGTGFSFSRLRPSGDVVKSTGGVASGPVSFMKVFDAATEVIKQGGRRRGANMGLLRVDHPDIMAFISSKEDGTSFQNFNISVGITDAFMAALKNDGTYSLINPRTGGVVKEESAKAVFDRMAATAWRTGDPGLVFIDEINRHNPTPKEGAIESTNPCGEVPLLPYESCNLGSINLTKMVSEGKINREKLKRTVHAAVHFLDNVIDANKYPLQQIGEKTKENRKIGIGVMGFAELLIMLGIPYDSKNALDTAEEIMGCIDKEAKNASEELGKERGSFPNFKESALAKKYGHMRNATLTTVAPTGTTSIIAGCSSGIEPLFAVSFVRNVMGGVQLLETNPLFEQAARAGGFYSEELMVKVARNGSVADMEEVPDTIRELFVTAHDIPPEWHVRMQAAFQKHTDNAVSKTINLPEDASIADVEKAFLLAYDLKCKGITVYRYNSKAEQVLYKGRDNEKRYASAGAEYSGGCPDGTCAT